MVSEFASKSMVISFSKTSDEIFELESLGGLGVLLSVHFFDWNDS